MEAATNDVIEHQIPEVLLRDVSTARVSPCYACVIVCS